MSFCKIQPKTIVTVPNHRNLMAAWRGYGPAERRLIGAFRCETALTASQSRRLPAELRLKVVF